MDCRIVQEKLSCYADGVVDEATMEMIEAHLAGCPECRSELTAIEAVRTSMSTAAEVEPPAGLKLSIWAAIGREAVAAADDLPADCLETLSMLSEFVDGMLSNADVVRVSAHLDVCPDCAREAAGMRKMLAAVADVEEVEPPTGLRARIAAATVEKVSPLQRLSRVGSTIFQPAKVGLAAGVAGVAAIIIFAVGRPNQPAQSPRTTVVQEKVRVKVKPVTVVSKVAEKPRVKIPSAKSSSPVVRRPIPAREKTIVVASAEKKPVVAVKSSKSVIAESKPAEKQKTAAPDDSTGSPVTTITDKSVVADKSIEPSSSIPAVEEAKTEKNAEVDKKPGPVQVAAEKPAVAPEDNKAMIRSLKLQMRMQKRGEGVSINLFGSKF